MLVLVAVAALVAREDRSLPGGVPAVPTPPDARNDREATPLPDPFAYDEDRKDEFEQRAAAGSAHVLYARSPGGAGATAAAGRALAARRSRPPRARRASRRTSSRRSSSSRAPAARTRWRATPRARSGSPRSSPRRARTCSEMRVDVAAQPPLHAPHPARAAARPAARGAAPARRPPQGRPALRPRPGAGRHRALPQARQGALPPRRHGLRLLPHGDGQPRERPARLRRRARRRGRLLHAGLLRLHAAAQRRRPAQARLLRRRLLQLPVEARRGARDHAPVARGRGRARPPAGRPDRQGVGRGGPAPAGLDGALHDARAAAEGLGRRGHRRVPGQPARDRAAARRRAWASWRAAGAPSLYRGLRPEALATALYIGAQTRALRATRR